MLLDNGAVFTGDLTLPALAVEEQAARVSESWRLRRARGAARVHPGHGPVYPIDRIAV